MEQPIAAPPHLIATLDPALPLIGFGVLVAIASVYAVILAIRDRDPLPVLLCIGSAICALNEPIYDILGKIVYAQNAAMAYHSFGRNIPWFLVIGYIPFVGLLPYLIMKMMKAGCSRRLLHMIALGAFLAVVGIETLGTSFGMWIYYGDAPLKFLVVAPQMAPVPIVGGFLLYAITEPLKGWRRQLSGMAISTLALPMVFASASWPLYIGLYGGYPSAVNWALGALMLTFCAATVVAATAMMEEIRSGRTSANAGD